MPGIGKRMGVRAGWWNSANKGTTVVAIVARLMHEAGLCGRQKGRYRVRTTDSNHDEPIAPNRLVTAPKATAPNQIWVGDITYIETQEGWLYLAASSTFIAASLLAGP